MPSTLAPLIAAGATLAAAHALAQPVPCDAPPLLQTDVVTSPSQAGLSSSPGFVRFGAHIYFSAFRPGDGWTLWRTDGTEAGTGRVSTLSARPSGTTLEQRMLLVTEDSLYFTSNASAVLWRSDGSDAGTAPIDTAVPTSGLQLTAVGPRVVYRGATHVRGFTPGATPPVDLVTIPTGGGVSTFATLSGRLLFAVFTAESASTLYSTDGTAAGTAVLGTFSSPDSSTGRVTDLFTLRGRVYFLAGRPETGVELYASDGTPAGTKVFHEFSPGPFDWRGAGLAPIGVGAGKLFLNAAYRLHATDGATVVRVAEVTARAPGLPGPLPTLASGGVLFAGSVPFPTEAAPYLGREPFVSDGTPEGSGFVAGDIRPGELGSMDSLTSVATLGGRAFFSARDGSGSTGLWATNGTPAGTYRLVADGLPEGGGAIVAAGGRVFFMRGTAEAGGELWVTDGTVANTRMVADVNPDGSSYPSGPVEVGGRLVFAATDHTHNRELWVTDGTVEGTRLLADIAGGSITPGATGFAPLGGGVVFGAAPSVTWSFVTTPLPGGLHRWDGSRNPAEFVTRSAANAPEVEIRGVTPLFGGAGLAYFIANGPLHRTDGTPEGTLRLTVRTATAADPGAIQRTNVLEQGDNGVLPFRGGAIFQGSSAATGIEPAITDGTVEGTRILKDVAPGTAGSNPGGFTTLGELVVFFAATPALGYEPWVTDGTEAGTRLLADLAPGVASSTTVFASPSFRLFGVFDGRAYFLVRPTGPNGPVSLASTDGTPEGTGLVDLGPGLTLRSGVPSMVATPRGVFFWASTQALGEELFVTDGTPGGTHPVRELFTGSPPQQQLLLGALGDFATFIGPTSRLWISDGTAAGTRELAPTVNGLPVIGVRSGPVLHGRTYFVARSGSSALWALMSYTDDPNEACPVGEFSSGTQSFDAGPPWGLTGSGSRLFLHPPNTLIGAEPGVIDLCPGDFDNSGAANIVDIFRFLSAWFGAEPAADFDGSGERPDPVDLFGFLGAWFADCG